MAKVEIIESLRRQVDKDFKKESIQVFQFMKTLEDNPKKGKPIANDGGILIKQIRYKSFRFFFVTDGEKIKCIDDDELVDVILRFVRMADKKEQQYAIEEMKKILLLTGLKGFE